MKQSVRLMVLQKILRPIVRFMLEAGHSIQDFIEVLKLVYVQEARDIMAEEGKKVNPSRLVMTTGVHRLEVNRLLEVDKPDPSPKGNMLYRIIGQWEQKKRFQDKNGKPKVLSYKGPDSQFVKLLQSISLCLIPGTVLFELERRGIVEKTPKGLKLISTIQRHGLDSAEKYDTLGDDVHDIMTALQENIERPQEKRDPGESGNLHLRTEYDNVYVESLADIRAWLVREGKKFHQRAREYIAKHDRDVVDRDGEAGGRVVLTAFSLTEPNGYELHADSDE